MVKRIFRYIAVGLVVASLILLWLLLRRPSMPTAEASAEAAKSFDEKMARLAQAQEQQVPGEIRLTEVEINSKIQEGLKNNPPPAGAVTLKGAVVHLEGDKLRTMLTVNVKGIELVVTVGGTLDFSQHTVRLIPSEVRLGSLPVPASLMKDRIDMQMQVPASVAAMRIENGELVVQAQ
ncbi:MAG: hypothetical protein MUP80_02130 [Acidobacteriia bacterium]|nr:hypothetical protein [Terriglobia bacterium]